MDTNLKTLLGEEPYPMFAMHLDDMDMGSGSELLRKMSKTIVSARIKKILPKHVGIILSFWDVHGSRTGFPAEVEELCAVKERLRAQGFTIDIHVCYHHGKYAWLETLKKRHGFGRVESSFELQSIWWLGNWTWWGFRD